MPERCFIAGEGSREARKLAWKWTGWRRVDAARVADAAALHRVAEVYASRDQLHVTVREGAFHGEWASMVGPPPYVVYEVMHTTVFGSARTVDGSCPARSIGRPGFQR